jgi:sec-independent protein translocase protein TatC
MVVYLLTSIGILTPQFLKTYRRHAIVVIMVVAAIITPADVLSMMAAAMPLVILYEMSIWMSIYVSKKLKNKKKL